MPPTPLTAEEEAALRTELDDYGWRTVRTMGKLLSQARLLATIDRERDARQAGLAELLDRALLAEALFEARIGIPQDTPLLADALRPPLLRLLGEAIREGRAG